MTDLQLKNAIATTSATEEVPLNEEENSIMESAIGDILLYQLAGPMSFVCRQGYGQKACQF